MILRLMTSMAYESAHDLYSLCAPLERSPYPRHFIAKTM